MLCGHQHQGRRCVGQRTQMCSSVHPIHANSGARRGQRLDEGWATRSSEGRSSSGIDIKVVGSGSWYEGNGRQDGPVIEGTGTSLAFLEFWETEQTRFARSQGWGGVPSRSARDEGVNRRRVATREGSERRLSDCFAWARLHGSCRQRIKWTAKCRPCHLKRSNPHPLAFRRNPDPQLQTVTCWTHWKKICRRVHSARKRWGGPRCPRWQRWD